VPDVGVCQKNGVGCAAQSIDLDSKIGRRVDQESLARRGVDQAERGHAAPLRRIAPGPSAQLLRAAEMGHAPVLRNAQNDGLDGGRGKLGGRRHGGQKDDSGAFHQPILPQNRPTLEAGHEICFNPARRKTMARRNISRVSLRALAPVIVPLVTKVAVPIVLESLKRRKFDTEGFLEDAKESIGKGLKKSRLDLDEVKDEVRERGQKIYEEARKQGTELLEVLAEKGAALADELLEGVRPKPRRRFRLVKVLGIAAVIGVGIYLINRD
jgi:vacuolar-type H+-ATPase subunit H